MATANRVQVWPRGRTADLGARRLSVSAGARCRWSATIADFLRAGFAALAGRTIGVYSPFRGEPNVRAAIDHWRAIGATTALPVVVTRGSPLEFRAFWPGVRMREGVVGLSIPLRTPVVTPQVLLMPMVAFDTHGYRLRHGGGYFDRTLAALAPPPPQNRPPLQPSRVPTLPPPAPA